MTTQALRTTLLVFLSIYLLSSLAFVVSSFSLEQIGFRISHPDIFDMAYLVLILAQWAVVITSVIGLFRAFKRSSAPLPGILHFPMIWYFTSGLFSFGFHLLHRPDPDRGEMPLQWLPWVFHVVFVFYSIVCSQYFLREKAPASTEGLRWVSSWSRLGAYLLDILLVMAIFFVNLRGLAFGRSVLDNIPFFNDSPYPMISIVLFLYYFGCEAVFGRTLGKAVNGSFVVFERGRVLSALGRTLSRYIPLEALSFMGKHEGWHDTLSGTTVRQVRHADQTTSSGDERILRADQLM